MALAPPDNLSISAVLDELRTSEFVSQRIAHEVVLEPQSGRYAPWPAAVHPALVEAMERRGVPQPYSHQAEAVKLALGRRDVVVVTPTASGKSLCYVLPTLDAWLRDPSARALWLFPTKALAQDQLASLHEIAVELPGELRAGAYDGDTPSGLRRALREDGSVVISNPDMLHSGILPHHTKWARLLQNLQYVVIDELHAYRGVFGSHLANVLRRLMRLCQFYGSAPTMIACSATIANPREFAERLCERQVHCIDESGAPRNERRIWLWNPPVVNSTFGIRRSAILEARRLTGELLRRHLQTVVFARSRNSVEVLLMYLQRLQRQLPGGGSSIRGYRGGYLPLERRAIEAGLRSGEVRAVVSTNALELGVDIGGLDAAVLVGYPGTIASTWQQLGRAGRRNSASLGVFIATDSPLDQFLVHHPEYLFDRTPENGLIDPDNLLILGEHVQASAFELAFEQGEHFGRADITDMLNYLADDGVVHRSGNRFHWSADAFPAEAVSLRRASATNVVIIDTSTEPQGPGQGPHGQWAGSGGGRPGSHGVVIGEVDQFSAPVLVHDDAVYLHGGVQHHVERLDWEEKRAYVHPITVDYYTLAQSRTELSVLEHSVDTEMGHCRCSLGDIRVSRLATAYKKVRFFTHETIGDGPIALPEQNIHTTAWWLAFDPASVARFSSHERESGLSGIARLLHHTACVVCMCDPRDVGQHVELRARTVVAVSSPASAEPKEFISGAREADRAAVVEESDSHPTIYLYDMVAGGVGLAEKCHERRHQLLAMAGEIVDGCSCASGCPACTGPSSGGVDAKAMTRHLLGLARG